MLRTALAGILVIICFALHAQNELQDPTPLDADQTLLSLLSNLEQRSHLKFFYLDDWLSPYLVSKDLSGLPLSAVLFRTLEGSDISFVYLFDYAVIFFKNPERSIQYDALARSASKRKTPVQKVTFGAIDKFLPGQKLTILGTVRDKATQSPLSGVFISVSGLKISTETDARGKFQLVIPPGEYFITFNFANYDDGMMDLAVYSDGEIVVDLQEKAIVLEEIVVSDQNMTNRSIGFTPIKKIELSRAPAFLGTVDIVKSLQIQAGVSSVSEASSGFNVRGGSVDQNLVLYDGIPILNTSHAMGFFSSFNSDVVKEISFYKGGIPAEFGGRVSSVLSMTSKEGDFQKWKGELGVGLVASNLVMGGPLKKEKSSLIFSIRGSYSDWALNFLSRHYDDIQESSVMFYDGSLKYANKLANGDKLTISGYTSSDRFKLASDTVNQWQNLAIGARYDHVISTSKYYSLSLNLGQYSYQVSEPEPATAVRLKYKITYPSVKWEMTSEGLHKRNFGVQSTFYNLKPGELRPTSRESNGRTIVLDDENSVETAVYFGDSFIWRNRFSIEAGLRLSLYSRIGSDLVFKYSPGQAREPRNIVDSTAYRTGEFVKTYGGPEPRVSLRYLLTDNSSFKFGYNRIYQYVHLVSNTATVTPVDIWQSSNTYFKPQLADQVSLGYFWNSKKGVIHGSIEMFYKHIENILDFKDGAKLILNQTLETSLLSGKGCSYGIEFSLNKTKGRLEAEMNYTFSRSLRIVNGVFDTEKINNGYWYASNYDQPNIFNINWRYRLTRKAFFSGIFTFRTGRPVSLPIAAYEVDHVPVIDFSERNNFRLDDYHRLDLAVIVEGSNKKQRRINGEWSFSVYNVYGRKNPYSAFFTYNVSGAVKPNQIALIGIPVPSVAYKIKF